MGEKNPMQSLMIFGQHTTIHAATSFIFLLETKGQCSKFYKTKGGRSMRQSDESMGRSCRVSNTFNKGSHRKVYKFFLYKKKHEEFLGMNIYSFEVFKLCCIFEKKIKKPKPTKQA